MESTDGPVEGNAAPSSLPRPPQRRRRRLPGWALDPESALRKQEEERASVSDAKLQAQLRSGASSANLSIIASMEEAVGLVGHRTLVMDVETTGFTESDSIVELAAVELVNGVRTGFVFHTLLSTQGKPIHAAASKVHGLTAERLATEPAPGVVLPTFFEWAASAVWVFHNAAFDLRMLQAQSAMLPHGLLRLQPSHVVCSLALFRKLYANAPLCDLAHAARASGVPSSHMDERRLHGALADAELTAALWVRLSTTLRARMDHRKRLQAHVDASAAASPATETTESLSTASCHDARSSVCDATQDGS